MKLLKKFIFIIFLTLLASLTNAEEKLYEIIQKYELENDLLTINELEFRR